MTFQELVAHLQATKGTGLWTKYAFAADVHYFTVAEIARGTTKTPKAETVAKIAAGIRKVDRKRVKAEASEAA